MRNKNKTGHRDKVTVNKLRWAGYALASTAAAVVGSDSAEADIVHIDSSTPNSGLPATLSATPANATSLFSAGQNAGNLGSANGVRLNFVHALSIGGNAGSAFFGVFPNPGSTSKTGAIAGDFGPSGFLYASNLAPGNIVSAGNFSASIGTLAFGNGTGASQFLELGDGYTGFRFNNNDGTGTQYGWARITILDDGSLHTFAVQEYAYTTAGEQIRVGQTAVPEPGTLGLLALGAAGLTITRRRKEKCDLE